jgi:hypothetical protein
MITERSAGYRRLYRDLLSDAADELHAKRRECEKLALANGILRAHIRILQLRLAAGKEV